MPVIDLSHLKCGDVILHSGYDKIVNGTGAPGRFGHALLVLNRLLYVHAPGVGSTARIEPFDLAVWSKKGDSVIGPQYEKDACVLRPNFPVDENAILSAVQLECGTGYADVSKLLQLEGLDDQLRNMLLTDRRVHRYLRNASPKGRSCGELVAVLLFGAGGNFTPNGLYSSGRFAELKDLVHKDGLYSSIGISDHVSNIRDLISDYDNGISVDIWDELVKEANDFKENPGGSMNEFVDRFERLINDRLMINIGTILDVGKYAQEVFGH